MQCAFIIYVSHNIHIFRTYLKVKIDNNFSNDNNEMYVYKVGFAQQSAEYMIAIDIIFTRADI